MRFIFEDHVTKEFGYSELPRCYPIKLHEV